VNQRLDRTVLALRDRIGTSPEVALILGRGLEGLGEALDGGEEVPWEPGADIGSEPPLGRLECGRIGGRRVAALTGRSGPWSGTPLRDLALPLRALRLLGARMMVLVDACAPLREDWPGGTLALIHDHINLIGDNPLIGPNDDALGPRFPDMSDAYDPVLRAAALQAADTLGVALQTGVYAAVAGPSLGTPAEHRMLRSLGADMVGTAVASDAIVARHMDLKVLGFGVISSAHGLSADLAGQAVTALRRIISSVLITPVSPVQANA